MDTKKVQRLVAVPLGGGERGEKAVDAWVSNGGKYLFVHKSLLIRAWSISQRGTGLGAVGNIASKEVAIELMNAMYRRIKSWKFKGEKFGKHPGWDKNKKFYDAGREVKDKAAVGLIPRMFRGRKEVWIPENSVYCAECGSTNIKRTPTRTGEEYTCAACDWKEVERSPKCRV